MTLRSTTMNNGPVIAATTRPARTSGLVQPAARGFEQTVGERRKEHDCRRGPELVHLALAVRVFALGDMERGDQQDGEHDRDVDVEHPAPRPHSDQVAPDQRAGSGCQSSEPGPGAYRPGAVIAAERPLQDRQAGRGEQCSSDSLKGPGDDQAGGVGSDAAERRCDGEPDDPDEENPLSPEPVAERAAEQDEGGEGYRVTRYDPLQDADLAVK